MEPEGTAKPFVYNPEVNYDEATMQQQKEIEAEVAQEQPLISALDDFKSLYEEFKNDPVYVDRIKKLDDKYSNVRRTRGDGNCFYRAFGFAYLEKLLKNKEDLDRFKAYATKSKDDLIALGFQQFTIEDFHSVFMETIDSVANGCGVDKLLETFNDLMTSDYIVVYLRLIVSGQLQRDGDFYASFIEGGRTMKEFCSQEVEPMGKESDHIHIIALTSATGIPVRVEHLDRNTEGVNHHDFPEDSTPQIVLLYRPGHYDILYTA